MIKIIVFIAIGVALTILSQRYVVPFAVLVLRSAARGLSSVCYTGWNFFRQLGAPE